MKYQLFPTLAWAGIKKNKKLYLPYIFSCIGSVMMLYIINFVSLSPTIASIKGGTTLTAILSIGKFIIAFFSLIFLFYTNSFLVRRRNKEFGLYNILGMDKKCISKIIIWEAIIVSSISIISGLFFGIAFSKLAELYLLYISHLETNFDLSISLPSIIYTVVIFAVIFIILLVKSVISVHRTDPLELMKSENVGEKPPKANWVAAGIGVIALAVAYYMAITVKSPLSALFIFFIAVSLVIIATYLIFISSSVALCKILQKNKKYYYKKNHFVSVSSMSYRMKRNGAGLASICILSTMVLVMMASSASLYFGADESIKARFPEANDITVFIPKTEYFDEAHLSQIRTKYENVFEKNNVKPTRVVEYKYAEISGLISDGVVYPDANREIDNISISEKLRNFYFVSVDEYNKAMDTDLTLNDNEVLIHTLRCKYTHDSFEIKGLKFNVKGHIDSFPNLNNANTAIVPSIMLVIPDFKALTPLENYKDYIGDQMLKLNWHYGYDLDTDEETEIDIFHQNRKCLNEIEFIKRGENRNYSYTSSCLPDEKNDFYSAFGGLLFIGIMFSIMFIFAMAMIIYYKQISEGFEDQSRFVVMQNVGMTKKDIKKSINSQTLTVFFAPLLGAGLHLTCAFPPIWKILQLFNFNNLNFIIMISVIAFVVFALIYLAIYKVTSKTYYSIVSTNE